MIQEEIIEVDKKIKQIEGILNKRKEKASEWNLHYKKVLEVYYHQLRRRAIKTHI